MNEGISAEANPLYNGNFGLGRTLPLMVVFVVAGLALLIAAYRVFHKSKKNRHHRRDRYTVHRH
jgi:hypothetical protein